MMRAVPLVLVLLLSSLAGCLGSDDPGTTPPTPGLDTRLVPSFNNTQPAVVTELQAVSRLLKDDETPFPSGSGNWVQGDYVYSSALNQGFFIADIADPSAPKLVFQAGEGTETPYARKAEVLTHPDGRLTLVLATQRLGMHLWNVTDPYAPEFADIVAIEVNHNIAVVPGTEYVFNAPSRGEGSTNHLVDISDPYRPVIVGSFGTFGCHGITFRGTFGDDSFRAYCAAIGRTEIWDMTGLNVTAPSLGIQLLGVVQTSAGNSPVVGSPALGQAPVRSLHHLAMSNADGTILIIGDEHQGGGTPGSCFYNDGSRSTPLGALWFYDITDESAPKMLGWISPPRVDPRAPVLPSEPTAAGPGIAYNMVPNCTAHFGTLVPGEEKLVMGWYSAGVLLIDFSDPSAPKLLAQYQPEGVNVWNARVHNGYVFTGDINRGLDIIQLV